MNKKVLILYLPTALQRMHPAPPLGIAILKGALREAGISVSIDDIEMKYWERDRVMTAPFRALVRMLPLHRNNPKRIFLNMRHVVRYVEEGILDRRMRTILEEWEELLEEPVSSFSHIGFSVMGESQLVTTLCFAKYIKEKYNVGVILGGRFFTHKMTVLIERYPFVDSIVIGEGEEAVVKILKGEPSERIPGFIYRHGAKAAVNAPGSHCLPVVRPDFDGLPFSLYRQYPAVIILYETSKGCRNNCAFCTTGKKDLFFKDIDAIINDLVWLKARYGSACFRFIDNGINVNQDFSIRFCERLIQRRVNISWSAYYIPEDASQEYFCLLKKAGCIQLRWGIETLSKAALKIMNKSIDFRGVSHALKKSHEAGIWNHLLFMVGHPGEPLRDILKTMSFIVRHRKYFRSAVPADFVLSRIDYLTDEHPYFSYYGTSNVKQHERLGLVSHEYKDTFLWLKQRCLRYTLRACGIKFRGNFSRYKKHLERDQYLYGVFGNLVS